MSRTKSKKAVLQTQGERKVLNVGGNSKDTPIPIIYDGWNHVLLDIDPKGKPDVVCDARNLVTLAPEEYDAVYCSHNLEHYHHHHAFKVLQGFLHVLKDGAFAHIRVPDMMELMKIVVAKNLDIDDIIYESPAGPIMVRDVMYGYSVEIERSGNDYYAHKTGFSARSLQNILLKAGFKGVLISQANLEIIAIGIKSEPSEYTRKLLFRP